MATGKPTLLVIGGAGAQNGAVIKFFSSIGTYSVQVLTRSLSGHAQELAALPNVTLIEGDCFDEDTLYRVMRGVDYCYVNTNGFAIGEKSEIYWGIRLYEIANWIGVKHFIYSALPYVSKNSGFNPDRRVPFVDGKAKVAQYLAAMPTDPMRWSVISSGPYADFILSNPAYRPQKKFDGIYSFALPLGSTGAMPLVDLDSFGQYAQWIIEHPSRSAGLQLEIAIAHVSGADMAAAFENVTGHKTTYDPVPLEKTLAALPTNKIGLGGSPGYDDPTLKTSAQHFRPWWTIFQESGGNTGLWTKNYALLDEILPERTKTIEQWMRNNHYTGEANVVLKTGLASG